MPDNQVLQNYTSHEAHVILGHWVALWEPFLLTDWRTGRGVLVAHQQDREAANTNRKSFRSRIWQTLSCLTRSNEWEKRGKNCNRIWQNCLPAPVWGPPQAVMWISSPMTSSTGCRGTTLSQMPCNIFTLSEICHYRDTTSAADGFSFGQQQGVHWNCPCLTLRQPLVSSHRCPPCSPPANTWTRTPSMN